MSNIPQTHIVDAQKLIADGKVILYKLQPVLGGTIYFKNDNQITWRDNVYEGLPVSLSGEKFSSDTSTPTPRMTIGQEDMDLLPFKGLMHDGYLDGAKVTRHKVLLDHIKANLDIKETDMFRVKRVENYSRTRITLILASFSGVTGQTYPFRQYIPPAFPWVEI